MSLTLADIEGMSSDSDDEEYVPEGGGLSSDDSASEGDLDTHVRGEDSKSAPRATKARLKKGQSRKRKARGAAGSKVKGDSEAGAEGGESDDEERLKGGEEDEERERKEKARLDDLWASFKQDTGRKQTDLKGKSTLEQPTPPKKLKIQKTYDFAGEEIVVEKEVLADSKEAKKYLEKVHVESAPTTSTPSLPTPGTASVSTGSTSKPPQAMATPPAATERRKGSGLGSVLKSIGKKTKMSTLEKSSLDWSKYKSDYGLEEELARNSKDGYLARQEFLQWSDQKQFELEKNERLKRFKRL